MNVSQFQKRVLQTKFEKWLGASVYINEGTDIEKRQYVINELAVDLTNFLRSFGYTVRITSEKLAEHLARFMFKTQIVPHTELKCKSNPNERPEDYDMYIHHISSESWTQFFDKYNGYSDFDMSNSNGRFIIYSIPSFVWYYVNIDETNMNEQNDDGGEGYRNRLKKKSVVINDPYLIDQQNYALKYNRWD